MEVVHHHERIDQFEEGGSPLDAVLARADSDARQSEVTHSAFQEAISTACSAASVQTYNNIILRGVRAHH